MNPTGTWLKPTLNSWTIQGPHGPWITLQDPHDHNEPSLTLLYLNLIVLSGIKGDLALCDIVTQWHPLHCMARDAVASNKPHKYPYNQVFTNLSESLMPMSRVSSTRSFLMRTSTAIVGTLA